MVAINKVPHYNQPTKVHSKYGTPFGGFVFDSVHQQFLVNCDGILFVGTIGVLYKLEMDDILSWSMPVPVPESVIKRYLSEPQQEAIKKFKSLKPLHDFQFIQLIYHNQ